MSIQSEVSRIDGAKGALKTAIEGKGVAVPEDARIDGYAALVDEIQHGTGDMKASVYDPQNKAQDVFAYADGKEPLRVVINSDDPLNMTSSHTIAQIKEAYESGRYVYAEEGDNAPIPLHYVTDEECRFSQFGTDSSYKTLSEYYIELKIYDGQEHISAYMKNVKHLPLSGGTMTGALTLSGAPTADLHAATKKYVDDSVPDVTGKADKAVPSAAGNVAALDASGNLADSGKKPADFAAAGHTHAADDITSGVVPVANGGTGTTTLTRGYALIGNGTNAVTLRAITDISSSVSTISISSNLITSRAITNILNRSDTIFSSNTNYATYMARGTSLNSAETTPTKNGTIAWTYE